MLGFGEFTVILNLIGLGVAGIAIFSGLYSLWRIHRNQLGWWRFLLVRFSLIRIIYFVGIQGLWMGSAVAGSIDDGWRLLWAIRKIAGNLSLIFIHWLVGRDAERIAAGINKLAKVRKILDRL